MVVKKLVLVLLVVAAVACVAVPAMAWDPAKQKDLGQDGVKMQWYLLDYGTKENGTPFAVVRKYYTNETIKRETIDLLMSKYTLSPEIAGSLYFTEYEYEYSKDGKQFAVAYLRHYDMLGNEIYGTVYDDSSDAVKKAFVLVDPKSIPGKAKESVMPAPAPQKAPAKKAPAKKK